MEIIVVYNAGRDAAKRGDARAAPQAIDYPIVSRYEPFHYVRVSLSSHNQREWLRGYDRSALAKAGGQ